MTVDAIGGLTSRAARFFTLALVVAVLAGCSMFGPQKLKEEPIIPAATLYQKALDDMDRQYYATAIKSLEQLDRQHPRDALVEKSKLMQVYANYRGGMLEEAILAADRYMALYANKPDAAYVLYL